MRKFMRCTLLSEEFRHFIQVTLIPSECFARIPVAIADNEMRMDMLGIGMHCEQHIKSLAVKESFGKFPGNLKRFFMGQVFVIIWMEGYGHFVGKVMFPVTRFASQSASKQHIICKMLPVSVKCRIQVIGCFDNTLPNLFRIFP